MRLKTTGRAALILAAGLWVGAAALFPATDALAQTPEQPAAVGSATGVTAEAAPPTRLHPKKTASKSRKAERHAKAKKPAQNETAETAKAAELKPTQDDAMPPAIANANAQWPTDAKPTDSYNMTAKAGTVLSQMDAQPQPTTTSAAAEDSAGASQLVASDQLNDLDRAAEDKPPLTLAKATIDAPAAAEPAVTAETNTPWDKTSMIGKIFIALGGVLTLASAARMFMA